MNEISDKSVSGNISNNRKRKYFGPQIIQFLLLSSIITLICIMALLKQPRRVKPSHKISLRCTELKRLYKDMNEYIQTLRRIWDDKIEQASVYKSEMGIYVSRILVF